MTIDFIYEPAGENGEIVCVQLGGQLNADTCEYLLDCVEGRIEDGYQNLILNCELLTYMSSMGLGMLVRVHSRMKKLGGDVKLANLHGTAAEILKLVRLDRVFEIYPSVAEAVAAFDKDL